MSAVVSVTGTHLTAGVLAVRLLDLAGVALLAWFVPRLAHALGSDRSRATWLAVLSPLLALELIGGVHNDLLMIGLLVAGVTVALRGRPVLGVALCTLAATIKLPALAAVLFIIIAWARSEPDRQRRTSLMAQSALTAIGVLVAVGIVTGVGFSWLTSSVFSTPAKVHLAITPATALGWTVADLLREAGVSVGHLTVQHLFSAVGAAITVGAGLIFAYRVRVPSVARYLGYVLLIAAACGPAAWPWYFTWGLVLLAGCPGLQRSAALAAGAALAVFLIKPNGILILPVQSSPVVLAAYVLLAAVAWRTRVGTAELAADGRARPGSARRLEPTEPTDAVQDLTRA
jgi:hypothetical protein